MILVFTHMSSTGYEDRRFFTAESAEHAENGCFPICSAPSACSAVRCGQSPDWNGSFHFDGEIEHIGILLAVYHTR